MGNLAALELVVCPRPLCRWPSLCSLSLEIRRWMLPLRQLLEHCDRGLHKLSRSAIKTPYLQRQIELFRTGEWRNKWDKNMYWWRVNRTQVFVAPVQYTCNTRCFGNLDCFRACGLVQLACCRHGTGGHEQHYEALKMTKVFAAWAGICRDRGSMLRRITRCWQGWSSFTRRRKKTEMLKKKTVSRLNSS